jgi:hypothetical protein
MPKRTKNVSPTHEARIMLIKEGRAHVTMLSNVLKSLEHYPKAVDSMLRPILKTLDNIEKATSREEKRRKE